MPKRIPNLSAVAFRSMKAGDELSDGYLPGLRVRRLPDGSRAWSLMVYDAGGNRRRFPVEADGHTDLDMKEARAAAIALKARVRKGEDPTKERRETRARAKAAREGVGTLSSVIDAYGAHKGTAKRSWYDADKRMRNVFARLLVKPAIELGARDFLLTADRHPSKSSANAALKYVRSVIKWAAERGHMPEGVYERVRPDPEANRRRERVLNEQELHAVLQALGGDPYDLAARMLLLTCCRLREITEAQWREVDLSARTLTISPERRKNSRRKSLRPLVVPLSEQACAIIATLPKGEPEQFLFQSRNGGSLVNWSRWQADINARSSTSGWHRHDLRRSAATLAGQIGTPPHVVEVMLGHEHPISPLASVYNRSPYEAEHRVAIQNLADALDRIESGGSAAANVIAFARA